MTPPRPTIEVVVFDLGGVVVELGPLTEILGDDPLPPNEFWSRWLASPAVRDFEMGRCSAEEFGVRLVDELRLSFSASELIERFLAWPHGMFPGSADLISSLEVPTAVLSNTNALHWDRQVDGEALRGLFDHEYLSFRLGLAKPDLDIFEYVIDDLGVAAGAIVFLDDNQPNVDAARSLGIDAHLVRGDVEARRVLDELGLVGRRDGAPDPGPRGVR